MFEEGISHNWKPCIADKRGFFYGLKKRGSKDLAAVRNRLGVSHRNNSHLDEAHNCTHGD
jgi:hypothetical protein